MTSDRFDIHVVPFPFSDRSLEKRRPAVLLCDSNFVEQTGNAVLAMVTSSSQRTWPGDHVIVDRSAAGLPKPSKVRMKIFSLDRRLLGPRIGQLSIDDADAVRRSARVILGL